MSRCPRSQHTFFPVRCAPPNVVLSCTSSVSLIAVVGVNAIFARKSCRRVWQERHNQSNNLVSQSESFTCQIDVKEVE